MKKTKETKQGAPQQRVFRFIWVLPILVMLLTSLAKLFRAGPILENFEQLNAVEWMLPFGVVQLCSTVLFLVPRTRRIGFFLLCSYLGGIIATRALHDVNHIGIVLLALLWIGMYFEDKSLFGMGK